MCDREGEARVKLSQYNTTQYFIQEIKTEVTKGTVYTDTPGLSCKGRNVSLGLKNACIGGFTLLSKQVYAKKRSNTQHCLRTPLQCTKNFSFVEYYFIYVLKKVEEKPDDF